MMMSRNLILIKQTTIFTYVLISTKG